MNECPLKRSPSPAVAKAMAGKPQPSPLGRGGGRRLLVAVVLLLAPALLAAAPAVQSRTATAVRAAGAITIDGRLDEPAWQQAPEQGGFVMPVGVEGRRALPPELQTSFRVLFDDDRLYLGITCHEPEPAKLVTQAARQHDAAMWSDDDVEVFLDPVGDRRAYYHFAVNSQGTQFDSYPARDGLTSLTTWSTEWQAATAVGQAAWTVEIAIPFAGLNQTPAARWSDRWAFNVARTRAAAPGYNSVFSETVNGYHDPAHFGTLAGVVVERGRYGLAVGRPALVLSPRGSEYHVTATVPLANQGKTPLAGTIEMQIGATGGKGQSPFSIPPHGEQTVELAADVPDLGRWPVMLRARDGTGRLLAVSRTQETLTYEPISITLEQPSYRNAIYPTQQVAELRGTVRLAGSHPADAYVTLLLFDGQPGYRATNRLPIAPGSQELPFVLPFGGLQPGNYALRATIWWPVPEPGAQQGGTAPAQMQHPPLASGGQAEVPLRVLPPAPAVEVRVDRAGRLLVDGQPVFIRGWYGSTTYLVSAASPVASRLPRATNFMMGSPPEEQANQGLYCLEGVDGLIDESKAKLDQPIDDELKEKLRAAVERVRGRHNVIGYYLSDEPECRGLSPVFLESAYRFLAQQDPYRVVMIVSRSPREYMAACDVMCPHPYLNPQEPAAGKRSFATDPAQVRAVIREAVTANDGGKAVWCMPQVFRYNGPADRHPTLRETRWTVCTALANGATGIVPFIFNAYWNHRPNRLALDYVFDELAILAPAWLEPGAPVEASSSNPAVDVLARTGPAPARHTYIVAANQGGQPCRTTLRVPALATGVQRRLVVLGENRVVAASPDGSFLDDFEGLGAHVYTTLEVLPILPTLARVQGEIGRLARQAAAGGNLLADPAVEWRMVEPGWSFSDQGDLADGVTNAAAWLPAYGDRTKCEIEFPKPVRFSRVVVYTPTIKAARLEIKQGGKWQVLHTWTDELLPRLVHSGQPLTAEGLRIVPTAFRSGPTGPGFPEITELEVYR